MVKMGREMWRSGSSKLVRQGWPLRETWRPGGRLPKMFSLRMVKHLKKHSLLGLTSSKRSPPSSRKSTSCSFACAITSSKPLQESSCLTGCFYRCPKCTSVATKNRMPASINRLPIIESVMQSYKAMHIIGQGSFGCVYLVRNDAEESFALKKIKVDPFQVEQALLEIELMKKFTHPNLVRVYEYHFDEDEEEMQIIMEYCEEGDLSHYFQQAKTLPTTEIIEIFRQILRAFLVMSVRGVIHRDLKPQNILLGKGRVVKIGDFGCAKMVGPLDMSKVDNFSLDKGTFLYASPEQLKNEGYSSKCDVWAAGCIAYLLAFGVHPFLDSKPHNTLLLIRKLTEGKFIELPADTDPTLAKLISLCLVYEDKERASWREIWLSRVFAPKVGEVRRFVEYLRAVSSIASWITKQFWKIRKEFSISKNSDEIFIYFIIKFQWTVLKMALKIMKKSPNYHYLFEEGALAHYDPSEEQFNELKRAYLEHEKYFLTIKKAMEGKESYGEIAARETKRGGCFSDLEKSIRACYKILTEVRSTLETHPKRDNRVWVALSYWINFQFWLSFEKDPRLEKFMSEGGAGVGVVLEEELGRYDSGVVE